MTITGVSYEEAVSYLDKANYHVKTALVMIKAGVSRDDAAVRRQRKQMDFVRARPLRTPNIRID
ncbi:MAG: hypothetical protein MZV64_35620 [Ignavibacteriales bacterium]|nr:hypothetical protein [Ignavibacteriales bacterium]